MHHIEDMRSYDKKLTKTEHQSYIPNKPLTNMKSEVDISKAITPINQLPSASIKKTRDRLKTNIEYIKQYTSNICTKEKRKCKRSDSLTKERSKGKW